MNLTVPHSIFDVFGIIIESKLIRIIKMMYMKKLITLGICSLFSMTLSAQKLDYDNDSKWFWGFNIGATWNTTDVRNRTNLGWGMTLGRSFNYNYGKKFSYDLRLRYLGGNWYGQDFDTTSINNPAYDINSPVVELYDSLGYTVNNFQTEAHELGLELVLHANALRERTGWDPYIFGGVNIVWNQTMGDLKLSDSLGGFPYPYSPEGITKSEWNLISDDIYDSPLDGSSGDKFNVNFMPSLGFGLAYQVGPRFSVGLEHKTTFTLKNNFDGFNEESMKWGLFENDIYHYTSAFLKFNLRKIRPANSNNNTNTSSAVTSGCISPEVRIVRPNNKTITVYARDYKVQAIVENIAGVDNIQYELNGIVSSNFSYETNNNRFESKLALSTGLNKIVIRAGNACGTATQSVTINYIDCVVPTIAFQNPVNNGVSVDDEFFMVAATINGAENVVYQVNGMNSSNFTFNSSGNSFSSNQKLREGNNTMKIIATNACGSVEQVVNVEYTTCLAPLIKIVRNARGAKFNSKTHNLLATIVNVENGTNIVVQLNGVNQGFDFNAQSGSLKSSLLLSPGANNISITASNTCGSDEATMTVVYTPCKDPSIEMLSPGSNSSTVQSSTQLIQAKVLNITAEDQVRLELNGALVTGGAYSLFTNIFQKSVQLQIGLNTLRVTATNDCGSATTVITIRRETMIINNSMITICHYPPGNPDNPQQLEIPLSAWEGHQAHGDVLGPCPNEEPANDTPPPAEDKITICHYPPGNKKNPQQLEIPLSAWPAHEAHGDVLGPCPEEENKPGKGEQNKQGKGEGNKPKKGGVNGNEEKEDNEKKPKKP